MSLANIVLFLFCFQFVFCRNNYKASIVDVTRAKFNVDNYASLIHEAAKLNADIFVLPTQESSSKSSLTSCGRCIDNYDEIVKTVSNAAKSAKIYVVTHVYEKINCDLSEDLVRSNLVFDRNGDIISVYRKPFGRANCNATYSKAASFSTDFGVEFGVLMEEDLVLQNVNDLSLHNYIVLGAWPQQMENSVENFASSWAFTTKSNVISMYGIYGNTEKDINIGNIIVGELNKYGNDQTHLTSSPSKLTACPEEDQNQYIIRTLDLELSAEGYKETVCHEQFCCQFYVKTGTGAPSRSNATYVLTAHATPLQVAAAAVHSQSCALAACKRPSSSRSDNEYPNIMFEKISVSANFSKNSAQFPILLTTAQVTIKNFKFEQENTLKHTQINTELYNSDNLLKYGIFSTDYTNDVESKKNSTGVLTEFSNYISNENVQEFFDYLWIRLRVVAFIVSIYILEMM